MLLKRWASVFWFLVFISGIFCPESSFVFLYVRLEKLIFGNASDVIANLDTDDELEFDESPEPTRSHTQTTKRVNEIIASPSEEDSGVEEGDLSPSTSDADKTREPVWMDEDDDNIP